ncbi:MAG TPA: hypothetical protein VFH55_02470 [Nitrospiria bacterium]|nr:hypothetical protein [Nitrospiria bacterium]
MLELSLVLGVVTVILAVRWVMNVGLTASTLTELGLIILTVGIIEGIPTGLYYHVILFRLLRPRGQLPPGWWISPGQYHVHLSDEESRRVRRWFFLGGLGFLLCIAGGILALSGMVFGKSIYGHID